MDMKHTLTTLSRLGGFALAMMSGQAMAGQSTASFNVSLTVVPTCSVNTASTPSAARLDVTCANYTPSKIDLLDRDGHAVAALGVASVPTHVELRPSRLQRGEQVVLVTF
jgi:hypothetical protein